MDGTWTKVAGFEDYSVSTSGLVRRDTAASGAKAGRILKTPVAPRGYKVVVLSSNAHGRKTFTVHRLVAIAFIENPGGKRTVNHKDGDKLNNNVANLEWATSREQADHAVSTGLFDTKGEKHHLSKLRESDIVEIRRQAGTRPNAAIGADFGVSRQCIRDIISGRNWSHVRGAA